MKALAAAIVAATACRPAPPALRSCADDLGGVWRASGADATTPSGEPRRYDVVDLGRAIEIYPTFDDSVLAASDRKLTTADAVIVAPAAYDLTRTSDGAVLIGAQTRRFARGAVSCTLHSSARIATCSGDRIELEQTAIAAPADWARCAQAPAIASTSTLRRERD